MCVSVAVIGCRVGFNEHRPPPAPPAPAMCPTALVHSDENCPASGCGLNGIWLGDGVPFRTLHTSPLRRNEAGLSIVDFRDARGQPLQVDIAADVLAGRRGAARLTGDKLNGAVLTLTDPTTVCGPDFARFVAKDNLLAGVPAAGVPAASITVRRMIDDIAARTDCRSHVPIYQLTIVDVHGQPFWETDADASHPTTPAYNFSARVVNADSCAVQVCRPGLAPPDPDDPGGIAGTAVIFAGDYYDDHYRVLAGPPTPADSDSFNIACLGTTISKLHLLRHTVAARTPARPAAQRQALMSLIAADYCGNGHPFTSDGVPLRLQFANASQGVTAESKFGWNTCEGGCTLDAAWAGDGHGASCIGTPRVRPTDGGDGCAPSADGTRVVCRAGDHELCERPSCPSDTPAYVTSGTPPS